MVRMPSVGVVLNWRNQSNKSGLYPVHIRIKLGNTARYYNVPLPLKIRPDQWRGKDDTWVKPSHPFAFEINATISEKMTLIYEHIKRNYAFGKALSLHGIMAILKNKGNSNSFYEFMEKYIKNPPEKLEINTIKKYTTTLAHLRFFRKELLFSDIDNNFLRDFTRFMQVKLNLCGGSSKKYLESLKKVIRQARREDFIPNSQLEYLFDGLTIKVQKPKRVFLEVQEVRRWKALKFSSEDKYLERDRDLFLFQIYTGYYYKDLSQFTKDQLQHDEEYGLIILGIRDKNGNQTIIPLFKFPYAQAIIEKYGTKFSEKYVFHHNCLIEEPVYNRNLKVIAKMAGIQKNITNKVARHTNAQLWIRYGAESAVLSKMLGHTKQETTKNYYSVNLPEVVEGTKRVNFEKMGI